MRRHCCGPVARWQEAWFRDNSFLIACLIHTIRNYTVVPCAHTPVSSESLAGTTPAPSANVSRPLPRVLELLLHAQKKKNKKKKKIKKNRSRRKCKVCEGCILREGGNGGGGREGDDARRKLRSEEARALRFTGARSSHGAVSSGARLGEKVRSEGEGEGGQGERVGRVIDDARARTPPDTGY